MNTSNTTRNNRLAQSDRACALLAALAVVATFAATQADAKFHPAQPSTPACAMQVSDLSSNGKPLTYEALARASGSYRIASTGGVYTPPVTLPNGQTAVFEVTPDGCARRTGIRRYTR